MKIFISGKINGCKNYRDIFSEAERKLIEIGCTTVNPCIVSDKVTRCLSSFGMKPELKDFMREDIRELCGCDDIFMLDNWTDSEGATYEFLIAKKVLGIPIFFSVESLKEELLKNTD